MSLRFYAVFILQIQLRSNFDASTLTTSGGLHRFMNVLVRIGIALVWDNARFHGPNAVVRMVSVTIIPNLSPRALRNGVGADKPLLFGANADSLSTTEPVEL